MFFKILSMLFVFCFRMKLNDLFEMKKKNEIHNEKHREKELCLLNIYAHHIHTIANQKKGQMPIAHNREKQK